MNLIRIAARVSSKPTSSCIYVDLDETLIHTFYLDNQDSVMNFLTYPGKKIQMSEERVSVLRPGANELLLALRNLNIGPIYLLTHSVSAYANMMVSIFDLDVDEIFPRESLLGRVGHGEEKFVLIDDLDPLHPVFQLKAKAMGILPLNSDEINDRMRESYYAAWQIKPIQFLGDPLDRGLEGVADRVSEMFHDMNPDTNSS